MISLIDEYFADINSNQYRNSDLIYILSIQIGKTSTYTTGTKH